MVWTPASIAATVPDPGVPAAAFADSSANRSSKLFMPEILPGAARAVFTGRALLRRTQAATALGSVSKSLNRLRRVPDDALRRCRSARIQETYPDEPPPCRTPPGTRLARPWTSRQTLVRRDSRHTASRTARGKVSLP